MLEFHCPWLRPSYSLAICWQVSPVNDEVHGRLGAQGVGGDVVHQGAERVGVGRNSSTLATVASFGLKPCCTDCFHIVAKSGGSGTLVKKSGCRT